MSDYIVARKGEGFEVAKFEDDDQPVAVYEVQLGKKPSCTCPVYTFRRKVCKHIALVQTQLEKGEL